VVSTSGATFDQDSEQLDVDGLAESISRPLSNGNCTYTVTVAMHPPELGHLQADVSLEGNSLQVSITAQNAAGHEALTRAADSLRDQLAQGGMNVNVSVRDPGHQPKEENSHGPDSSGDSSAVSDTDGPLATADLALATSQIHLVL